ncbi:MAG: hypothetical protein JNJ61_29120 [Anaerolineae bacterium]|nr:hypothetical protein [Anaerolineae bacterium]
MKKHAFYSLTVVLVLLLVLISSAAQSNYPLVEEFDSAVGFTQMVPDVFIGGGKVNWHVYRSPAGWEQYVYRSIPAFSGDVRITVVGQVNAWTNNCNIHTGIGDDVTSGVSIDFGAYGCIVRPVVMGWGVTLDYSENPACVYNGNWLWITDGTPYKAVLTISGTDAALSVEGVGTATGTVAYTGTYDTLFVGRTGDGDWPDCSGFIESVMIEEGTFSLTGDTSGQSLTTCHLLDGRLNDRECGAPVAVYCSNSGGIDVYKINDRSHGELAVQVLSEQIETMGVPADQNTTLASNEDIIVSRLTTGEFQVNAYYQDGKPYTVVWDNCPASSIHTLSH